MNRKERRAAKSRGQGGGASSGSSDALFAQALRHHQLGQWFEAEAVCRTIVEHDPRHLGSLHLLGALAQSRGAHDEAASRFRSVIAVKPDVAAVHYSLGRSLAETGRLEEAVRRSSAPARSTPPPCRGSRRAPTTPGPISILAISHGAGPLCRGAALYERALALRPELGEAHNNLGALLLSQGKLAEASARFVRALDLCAGVDRPVRQPGGDALSAQSCAGGAVERAAAAWPRLLPERVAGPGGNGRGRGRRAVASGARTDHRPRHRARTFRHLAAPRPFRSRRARGWRGRGELRLACAVARQCFINEYVFAAAPDELAKAQSLNKAIAPGRTFRRRRWPRSRAMRRCMRVADPRGLFRRNWPVPRRRAGDAADP